MQYFHEQLIKESFHNTWKRRKHVHTISICVIPRASRLQPAGMRPRKTPEYAQIRSVFTLTNAHCAEGIPIRLDWGEEVNERGRKLLRRVYLRRQRSGAYGCSPARPGIRGSPGGRRQSGRPLDMPPHPTGCGLRDAPPSGGTSEVSAPRPVSRPRLARAISYCPGASLYPAGACSAPRSSWSRPAWHPIRRCRKSIPPLSASCPHRPSSWRFR